MAAAEERNRNPDQTQLTPIDHPHPLPFGPQVGFVSKPPSIPFWFIPVTVIPWPSCRKGQDFCRIFWDNRFLDLIDVINAERSPSSRPDARIPKICDARGESHTARASSKSSNTSDEFCFLAQKHPPSLQKQVIRCLITSAKVI